MRLKKKVLALIIVAILIMTSLVIVSVNSAIQGSRIAYVTVKTDKSSYEAGENVTFELVSLTQGVEFNISQPSNPYQYSNNFVSVIRLPDSVDRDWLINNMTNMQQSYGSGLNSGQTRISYDHFNSTEGPLRLSWNGSIQSINTETNGLEYGPVTSGYYLLMPYFEYYTGRHIQFMLDQGAIFYYNSLSTGLVATNHPSKNVTYEMALKMPPGITGDWTCDLHTSFTYYGNAYNYSEPVRYSNMTGIVLHQGQETKVTVTYDVGVPDQGQKSYYDGSGSYSYFTYSPVSFMACLVTPSGNYSFGFSGTWNGGWENVNQY